MITPSVRRIGSVLLAALLVPSLCPADDYQDAAEKAVEAARRVARLQAQELVQIDLDSAVQRIMDQLAATNKVTQQLKQLENDQSSLEAELLKFSDLDPGELAKVPGQIQAVQERYRGLVRMRFDLSWVPVESRDELQRIFTGTRDYVGAFKDRCDTGRSDSNIREGVWLTPTPPAYHYRIDISTQGGLSYQGYNYNNGSTKTLNDIGSVVNTVTGYTASSYIGLHTGIVEASKLVTLGSHVFPYALVASAALAIAMHYLNMAEANRVAEAIARANIYKFLNTPRDQYITESYRQECRVWSNKLSVLLEDIHALESDPQRAALLISAALKDSQQIAKMEVKLKEASNASCEVFLDTQFTQRACAQGDAGEKADRCYATTDQLYAARKMCSLPADSQQRATRIASAKQILADVNKTYDNDRIWTLVTNKIIIALGENRKETLRSLSSVNFEGLASAQERAFVTLSEVVRLGMKCRQEVEAPGAQETVMEDLSANRALGEFRKRFSLLIAESIKAVFGKVPFGEVDQLRTAFDRDFSDFYTRYGQVPAVAQLQTLRLEYNELLFHNH